MTEGTSRWGEQEGHPSPEKLGAYFDGALSPEEREEIRKHLADCALCMQALRDLETFLDFPEDISSQEKVADFEAAAEWRDLWKRIEQDQRQDQERDAPSAPLRGFLTSLKTAYALAAIFAMATLGLSLYVHSLPRDQRSYDPNSKEVFLRKEGKVRGNSAKPLDLPRGKAVQVSVKLDAHGIDAFQAYRAVLYDGENNLREERDGLVPEDGEINFILLSDVFGEPGTYKISLAAQGQSEPIATYELRVTRK